MKNNHGQGLVEYLILVCLIAVSAIAVVTAVGTNIKEQYATISAALRGTKGPQLSAPKNDDYKERGFSDFNDGNAKGSHAWGGGF